MAVFNPDVPNTNDPSYIGLSRPISQYSGDQSMEVALKGIGSVIDAGLKATDTLVKEDIQDKVYEAVDTERDAFLNTLNGTQNPVRALSLVEEETPNVPTDLENLGSYLTNLNAAKDTGKISNSYYFSRLNSKAKEIRAQYPGWRDYIDKQFSAASGVNPANAELASRIRDLNLSAQARGSQRDQIEKLILQNLDIDQAPLMYEGWQKGLISDNDVIKWVHSRQKQEADYKLRKMEREDNQGDFETQSLTAKQDFDEIASKTATNYFENLTIQGKMNGKNIAKLIQDIRIGNVEVSTEDAVKLGQLVAQYRQNAFQDLWGKATSERGLIAKLGGAEKAKEIINNHLVFFDQMAQAISTKQFDIVGLSLEYAKGIQNDEKLRVLKDPDLGSYVRLLGVLKEQGGPEFVGRAAANILSSGLDPALNAYVNKNISKALTQHDIRDKQVQPLQSPYTLRQAMEETVQNGVTPSRVGKKQAAEVYNEYIKNIELIGKADTPDQIKLNAMKFAFDQDNRGVLSQFERDYKDDQGREIPGKHSIFRRMTSDAITKEVFRLGASNPQVISDYVAWAQQAFAVELFREEIRELNNIVLDPDFKIGWNNETHQLIYRSSRDDTFGGDFRAVAGRNFTTFPNNTRSTQLVKNVVDRLNNGLRNLSNISEAAGEDTNTFLLDFLIRGLGIDPTKAATDFGSHVTRAITNSMVSDKLKDKSKDK